MELGAQSWVSDYPPNFIKLSVLIFSPQSFQLFLMKLSLLGKILGAALHPPVQPLLRFFGGDTMVCLHLQHPKLEHWLCYIGADVPDIDNVSPLSVQK